MPFSATKIQEIEAHLANNPYLSEGGLPGAVDAQIYFDLGKLPDVAKTPNTHFWYLFINSFSNDFMKKWIERAPKPVKTQETKVPVKDEGDDLFDDEPVVKVEVKPKVEAPKKEKKKVIAKSIVVFDVKVYEQETNLDVLAKKIFENIKLDGLTWNTEPKKLKVAYGIEMLEIGCVIEDDKILTDDIFEPIEAWEEVQSVDMVSMQKL